MAIDDLAFKKLMDIDKFFVDKTVKLPLAGDSGIAYKLYDKTSRKEFSLDLSRGKMLLVNKKKFQTRYISDPTNLVRLEIDCPPHTNPDGSITSRNHMHIYKEGYDLAWAVDLQDLLPFSKVDLNNYTEVFYAFCKYCNIITDDNIDIQSVV